MAAAYNWDHNEHTVDGKCTIHAMTSIFIAPKVACNIEEERITWAPSYTLDADNIPGNAFEYSSFCP